MVFVSFRLLRYGLPYSEGAVINFSLDEKTEIERDERKVREGNQRRVRLDTLCVMEGRRQNETEVHEQHKVATERVRLCA